MIMMQLTFLDDNWQVIPPETIIAMLKAAEAKHG